MPKRENIEDIPVELIRPRPNQPRPKHRFNEAGLQELGDRSRAIGQVQPAVVRKLDAPDDRGREYELIAGERRWRAVQLVGIHTLDAVVRVYSPQDEAAASIVENRNREPVPPMAEAASWARWMEVFGTGAGALSQKDLADSIGAAESEVSNGLRMYRMLPEEVRELIDDADSGLEVGHGKVLCASHLTMTERLLLGREVARRNNPNTSSAKYTVRALEKEVAKRRPGYVPEDSDSAQQPKKDPALRSVENAAAEKLGAEVSLNPRQGGKWRLIVDCHSMDEMTGVLEHMGLTFD